MPSPKKHKSSAPSTSNDNTDNIDTDNLVKEPSYNGSPHELPAFALDLQTSLPKEDPRFENLVAAGIAIYALPNTFAPPHVRARAHGLAAAVGKVGAVVGSASYPLLLSSTGLAPLFLISCAVSGLSCLGAVLVPRPQPRATKLEHEPLIAPQTAADVDKSAEG